MKVMRADEERMCAQALELIHEDRNNRYYLSCMCSADLFIETDDGRRMNVRRALGEGRATVENLRDAGVRIVTMPKLRV